MDAEMLELLLIDSMSKCIKEVGQKKTLEIINSPSFKLTDNQRQIYRKIYFKTVQKLEGSTL